jgi:hypothetical protein
MVRRTSSRLARKKGKTMARQSMLMIVLAIAGSLLFLFVVVPQIVQLFFKFFGDGDVSFGQEDTVPPQVPIIAPPPEATTEDSVELEGFGEVDSEIVVVVNGEETDRIGVNNEGQFTYFLALDEGENLISLYGVDEAGNESDPRKFGVILDTEEPSLAFEDLKEGEEIVGKDQQNYTIRGETEPESTMTLNDRNVYVKLDGTFSTTYYLKEGDNTLKFVVVDKAGNSIERQFKVKFKY